MTNGPRFETVGDTGFPSRTDLWLRLTRRECGSEPATNLDHAFGIRPGLAPSPRAGPAV